MKLPLYTNIAGFVEAQQSYKALLQSRYDACNIACVLSLGETLAVVGSYAYDLIIPSCSDVDVWIQTNDVFACTHRVILQLLACAQTDPLLKSIGYNNLYSSFPRFEQEKEKILGHAIDEGARNIMISAKYYEDDRIQSYAPLEIHISPHPFVSQYDWIESLSIDQKYQLSWLKYCVYRDYEFFYDRSVIVYDAYRQGHASVQAMYEYLDALGKKRK